jgi:hypothetical protein
MVPQQELGLFPDRRFGPGPAHYRRAYSSCANLKYRRASDPLGIAVQKATGWRCEMDTCQQRMIQFLEKEIKTYAALALFLSKEGVKHRVRLGDTGQFLGPTFYRDRLREAKKLVCDLRKAN